MEHTKYEFEISDWIVAHQAKGARDNFLKQYGYESLKIFSKTIYAISELLHIYDRAGKLTDKQVQRLKRLTTKVEAKL